MQLSTILTRVEDITKVKSSDDLIKESIQTGLNIATSKDLPYLMQPGVIETVAPETTGTLAITKGTKAVVGAGTTFTLAMVGRKIRIDGSNTFYRIASFTSTTEITLVENFVQDTVTAATFSIFKDEYRLPADLDNYKVFRQIKNQQSMPDIEPSAFDIFEPSPTSLGSPDFTVLIGSKLDTDTTGTVTGSVGGSTLTGTSTAWTSLEGLGRGTKVTVDSNVFTVKSVESDTSLTIYENITADFSGSTPTFHLDNMIIQFFQIPDEVELIRFKYQRNAFLLIDDQDIPDLPSKWHHILVTAGTIWAWATKDKEESNRQRVVFDQQKRAMWKNIGNQSKNRKYPKLSLDRALGFPLLPPRFENTRGFPSKLPR